LARVDAGDAPCNVSALSRSGAASALASASLSPSSVAVGPMVGSDTGSAPAMISLALAWYPPDT